MLKIIQSSAGDASIIHVPDQLNLGYAPFVPGFAGTMSLRLYRLDGTLLSYDGGYAAATYNELIAFLNTTVKTQLGLKDMFSLHLSGNGIQYLNLEGFTAQSSFTLTAKGLLDVVTNAKAAYSLRRLRDAYTGAAIRVRNSANNMEYDIPFRADGTLDTDYYNNVINGNACVVKWYDQTGKGNHMVQTLAAAQPRLLLGQTGGRPAIVSDGVDDVLSVTLGTASFVPYTIAMALKLTGGTGERMALFSYNSAKTSSNIVVRAAGSSRVITHGRRYTYTWPLNSAEVFVVSRDSTAGTLYRNGVNTPYLDSNNNTSDIGFLSIFAEYTSGTASYINQSASVMSEFILWDSASGNKAAQTDTIQSFLNYYYNIY